MTVAVPVARNVKPVLDASESALNSRALRRSSETVQPHRVQVRSIDR
ncbi:hypothetical protein [Actinomadura chokoriensis]|uniref:FXSXX-COOH protein n=1 Tax=Actinomadura chokoriensis TaxID=454156 RepID=A0ABV4QTI2_9ACTN